LVVVIASAACVHTLVAAEVMTLPVAAGAATLLGGASALSAWARSARARYWRHLLSVALIVMAGLLVLASVGGGRFAQPGSALALVLVTVMVIHALGLEGVRELMVALALTMGGALLAVGLAPGMVLAVPLLVTWVAVVTAFALAQREQQHQGAVAVAGAAAAPGVVRRAVAARVVGTVTVAVVLGVVALLVVPEPPDLAGRGGLLGALTRSGAGGGGEDGGVADDVDARGAASYAGSTLDLRARGALGEEPVLEVPAGSPALWRGRTFDTYDGTRWTGRVGAAQQLPGGPEFVLPPDPADGRGRSGALGEQLRFDTVRTRAGFPHVVLAPGLPAYVQVDAGLVRVGSGGLVLTEPVTGYVVGSRPTVHEPAVLRAARGADPADLRWLTLPASLPVRVRDAAAAVTAGAADRHDALASVEAYLRATATYRLDSPVPGPGVDAVEDFLFVSRTGFCEQFAAAEVVLLRASGIPARLVTGYAYGDPVAGGRLMRARNAHAWVEVWFPGVGWSASDPTAGARLAPTAPPGVLERATAMGHALVANNLHRALLAVMLLALLWGGGMLVRSRAARVRRRRSRPRGRWSTSRWGSTRRVSERPAASEAPPLRSSLARLEAALAEAGTPRGPAESIAELATRLPALDGGAAAFVALEQDCFGPSPVLGPRALAAAETIDRLTAHVRAATLTTPRGDQATPHRSR
jgi:hypothetical protein